MGNYHLVSFDPGGTTGWAHIEMSERAFSRPEHKVLAHVINWNCGEFSGPEVKQLSEAERLIAYARGYFEFENNRCDVISEAFELKQTIGGDNLLSPVRVNAVLDWICQTKHGMQLQTQRRTMRITVTPERLSRYGFASPYGRWSKTGKGKDAFAAMQHAIVWLRRLKQASLSRPWKLSEDGVTNSRWDCACEKGKRCDIDHQQ